MNQKLAELILFISDQLRDDRYPGFKVKLHKILCRADFAAYRSRGQSITGETYIKYENGPFLQAVDPTVAKLKNAGVAQWAVPDQFNAIRLETSRSADLSSYTQEEIDWVREAIEWARHRETQDIVTESHQWFGWRVTPNGEAIPYSTAVAGDVRTLSEDENAWALSLITRYREHKRQKAEYCP